MHKELISTVLSEQRVKKFKLDSYNIKYNIFLLKLIALINAALTIHFLMIYAN